MKSKPITLACCIAAICTPVFAGEPAVAPAPAPAPTYDTYHWFLGGGGEYFFDTEEDYWNAHIGYNFNDASAIFLEIGWLGNESANAGVLTDVDIVPITLNYKYEWAISENFGWYVGVGAGIANVDAWLNTRAAGPFSDNEWSFTFQAFTGLVYEFSPSFETYLGVRYMWVDDFDLAGRSIDTLDDVSLGLGIRFNF